MWTNRYNKKKMNCLLTFSFPHYQTNGFIKPVVNRLYLEQRSTKKSSIIIIWKDIFHPLTFIEPHYSFLLAKLKSKNISPLNWIFSETYVSKSGWEKLLVIYTSSIHFYFSQKSRKNQSLQLPRVNEEWGLWWTFTVNWVKCFLHQVTWWRLSSETLAPLRILKKDSTQHQWQCTDQGGVGW